MVYNKTNWENNKTIITAEALNNIEDGIESISEKAMENENLLNEIKADAPQDLDTFKEVADAINNLKDIVDIEDTVIATIDKYLKESNIDIKIEHDKIDDHYIFTNTRYIQDKTGRTQDDINQVFYKKEIREILEKGKDIRIENAMGTDLLELCIEGETAKCYALSEEPKIIGKIDNNRCYYFNEKTFLDKEKTYNLIIESSDVTKSLNISIMNEDGITITSSITLSKNGINVFKINTLKDIPSYSVSRMYVNDASTDECSANILRACIVDSNIETFLPFGLTSTKSYLYNNEEKYEFCNPIVNGKTILMKSLKGMDEWTEACEFSKRDVEQYEYKLVSEVEGLHSTSKDCDYVDIFKKTKTVITKELVIDGSQEIQFGGTGLDSNVYKISVPNITTSRGLNVLSDNFPSFEAIGNNVMEGISTFSGFLYIRLSKEKNPNYDISKTQAYFKENPFTIRYLLEEPETIKLTEEELEFYKKHVKLLEIPKVVQTNSAYKANSIKLLENGEVDYCENIIKIDSRKIKACLNSAFIKYTQDEKIQYRCVIDGYHPRETKETVFAGNSTKTNTKLRDIGQDTMHSYNEIGDRVSIYRHTGQILIMLTEESLQPKDRLNPTREDFIDYFNRNKEIEMYVIVQEEVIRLPKKICSRAFVMHKDNLIVFDNDIKPSKVMATICTTDNIKKEYEVTLLNNYMQNDYVFRPTLNLLKNNRTVKIEMNIVAPSSNVSANLFVLPAELRPKTNVKIPVFVRNAFQLATLNASNGYLSLPTIPIANSNIYINAEYERNV